MNWPQLFLALGIGSIVAALIARSAAIAQFRQAWIDALREDVAAYFRDLQAMHHAITDDLNHVEGALERKRLARMDLLFVYWRITLRLNRKEPSHGDLKKALLDLMVVKEDVPDVLATESTVELARLILKREWEVTKYGWLTGPVLWWKSTVGWPKSVLSRLSEE